MKALVFGFRAPQQIELDGRDFLSGVSNANFGLLACYAAFYLFLFVFKEYGIYFMPLYVFP